MNAAGSLRSALFLDFDNVFLALETISKGAATSFASNPALWLSWLEQGLPGYAEAAPARRLLLRRCYLNPLSFGRYRPNFVRHAFSVIDCPPLTMQGKTSADIRICMDLLEALAHPTRFDEFILLSADADFTPVLLRLREHDRRTVVVAIGPASSAYKAAGDDVITEDAFLEFGLRYAVAPEPAPEAGGPAPADAPPPLRPIAAATPDALLKQVGSVAAVPMLSPESYQALLRAVSEQLARQNFAVGPTARAVAEALAGKGIAVTPREVAGVMNGIRYAGHRYGERLGGDKPEILAQRLAQYAVEACRNAGLELNAAEKEQVQAWLARPSPAQA